MKKMTTIGITLTLLLINMLTLAFNIQQVNASGTIYIRADGSVDPSTAPISSADNITYAFTANIYDEIVVERSNIIVDGNGETLQGTGVLDSKGFHLSATSNVTIKNTNIKDFYYGVLLTHATYSTLRNITITSNNGTGVYVEYQADHNVISENKIIGNGDDGVRLRSSYNTVSGNYIINNQINGIDINGWGFNNVSDNTIMNNSAYGIGIVARGNTVSRNVVANNAYGISITDFSGSTFNNTVLENNVTGNTEYGISLWRSSGNTLQRNIMDNNKKNLQIWCGRELDKWSNDIDDSNLVDGKPVYYWINHANEQIPSDAGYVDLINSLNITGRNLTLMNNNAGMQLIYTRNSLITENNFANNHYGIYTLYSSGNKILRNNITNNHYGVYGEVFNNNIFSENNMADADFGIRLVGSSSNIISSNNITNHRYDGFRISSGIDNKLYHNNFINNTKHATSYYPNYWENGYPSGGNYWSNYTSVDEKSGPNQDQPGSDGISDTPYNITWDGGTVTDQDSYPLMTPWPSGPGLHELEVSLKAPTHLLPENSTLLEATLSNKGFNDEENVTLFLFINNTVVNSTTISLLEIDSFRTINYLWTPTVEGRANVTVYATPVQGEIYVANNRETIFVTISSVPQVQNINTELYYNSIQEAIDAPETFDGHIIKVEAGTYYEHLTISKSLKIIGENRANTTIDGSNAGTFVIHITANNVVLSGFTIQNSNIAPNPAIRLYSSNNIISNNTIINNGWSIYAFSVSNNTIENNVITNNVYGVYLEWATTHTVRNNTIANHQEAGIYLRESRNNILTNNVIENNKEGIVLISYSNNNEFYHNNLIDNTSPGFAVNSDTNSWDNDYPSGGNYWSDYAGDDFYSGPYQNETGSDGIGDTPYTYWADGYPLMNPIGSPQLPIAISTYNPNYPAIGETVTFNATASYDRDGSIFSYEWNFGDGNVTTETTPIITHVYTIAGTYTVNLTVTDNDGFTHNTLKSITIESKTWTVDDDGPADFHTIQEAINTASPGDTVYVYKGTYYENVVIDKTIVLIGEDKETTIVDGNGIGTVVQITASNVSFANFKIRNSGSISGCFGISVSGSSFTISNTDIVENYIGIIVRSSSSMLTNNNVRNNDYGGIALGWSSNNSLIGNNIVGHPYYGILLAYSFDNTLVNNTMSYNWGGVTLESSSNNKIFHNNFMNPSGNVLFWEGDSANIWDDGYPSGGNFWSDYTGIDSDEDGIGDTPYVIDANNQDRYPLMSPYGEVPEDLTPPTTSHDYDGLWHTVDFIINLIATDNISGVTETYYKINDGPTKTASGDGQPLITTESINNTLEYWSIDYAGNEESHHILTGIKLDKTAPTGSIIINNGDAYTALTLVTLTLTASDATSDVRQVRYSNDGIWDAEPWETPLSTKVWTLTSGDETKTVYYQIKDSAGLVLTTYSDTITLDTIPPAGSIAINDGATYTTTTTVTLALSATDATSGIAQMRFSYDNLTWTPWEAYSGSKAWMLTTDDDTKVVYVQYRDNVGLISSTYQDSITLDTTKPTANAGVDQTVAEDTRVTFNGSASWDENGIATYTWTFTDTGIQTLSSENPTYNFTTIGTYIVTLTVEDAAGNTATDTVTITVLLDTDGDETPDATDTDDDNDGMPDNWETENELNPLDADDASLDPDDDGLTNIQEYQGDTDPNVSDAQAFPWWILGAAAAVIIGLAVAVTILWRRRE